MLRGLVQRRLGICWGLGTILVGTVISVLLASQTLVLAPATTFSLSELADFFAYTPLQRRRSIVAVMVSSLIGLTSESSFPLLGF